MRRTLALLLCLLLALTGCASSTQPAAQPEEPAPAAESESPAESETPAEPEQAQEEETPQQEAADPSGAAQVSILDADLTCTHEDGTELISIQSQSITVTVPGKPEVEESINADLRNLLESANADIQALADAAKEDYSQALEEEWEWYPYEFFLQAAVTRCDGRVLSLRFDEYQYTGGVHGYGFSYGRSYDLASGSRLTLDFMSAQGASFRDIALERVEVLCQTEDYAELLYPKGSYEDALSDVVQDARFYLEAADVVFLADPYLIGPYASGVIEFRLPYSELEGVLKENYIPA
ncbi:MAG: PdaC/SigV domain-containing protein [Candidatus Onthomonas sp.]